MHVLQFYKLCERWRVDIHKNVESLAELDKFKTTAVFNQTLKNISQRIGLTNALSFGKG